MRRLKLEVCGRTIIFTRLGTKSKIAKTVTIESYQYALREGVGIPVVETSDYGYLSRFATKIDGGVENILTPSGMRALMQLGLLPDEYVSMVRAEIMAKESARLTTNAAELYIADSPQVKATIMQLAIDKAREYVAG